MWIFQTLYKVSLLLILAGLFWLAYFFMTPVSPDNVESRARALCVIGNLASQANEKFALTPLAPKPLDCACVSAKLRRQYGSAEAARLTDTTRLLFINSVRNTLARRAQSTEAVDWRELKSIQAFFGAITRECPARP
jgi:hypothetical protein